MIKKDNLYRWLESQSDVKHSQTTNSVYFYFTKTFIVRYSDHFCERFNGSQKLIVNIIKDISNKLYIVNIINGHNLLGIPKIFTKLCDLKIFINDMLYYNNCIKNNKIESEEIIEDIPDKCEDKTITLIDDENKLSKDTINSIINKFDCYKYLTMHQRKYIINYALSNYWDIDMIKQYISTLKNKKITNKGLKRYTNEFFNNVESEEQSIQEDIIETPIINIENNNIDLYSVIKAYNTRLKNGQKDRIIEYAINNSWTPDILNAFMMYIDISKKYTNIKLNNKLKEYRSVI